MYVIVFYDEIVDRAFSSSEQQEEGDSGSCGECALFFWPKARWIPFYIRPSLSLENLVRTCLALGGMDFADLFVHGLIDQVV